MKKDQGQSSATSVGKQHDSGKKRLLEQEEEADQLHMPNFGKRSKNQQKENVEFSEQVVAASRNWPHLDQ